MKFIKLYMKVKKLKQIFIYIILFIIIGLGFYLRLKGIQDNHSFWSDEALVSSFARDIAQGKINFSDGMMKISYEPLQIGVTALFFKLFGIAEFSARLPSALFGTIGILFAYLIAKKLSNTGGGLIAAFLYAFSTLNLANATQTKPYATLETMLLVIGYLLLLKKKTNIPYLISNIVIILLLTLSTFVHYIGVMFWIIYIIFLHLTFNRYILKNIKNPKLIVSFALLLLVAIKLLKIDQAVLDLFKPSVNGKTFILFNNIMYLKNLLIKQYGIFIFPSIISILFLLKKYKGLAFGLLSWIFTLLFMWNFRSYSHNIRYLVPLFGIIFVFFGVFVGKITELISNIQIPISKQLSNFQKPISKLIPIFVILLLIFTQYKIYFPLPTSNLQPPTYFSPNLDFYGDVQAADYKTMYSFIRKQVPDYKSIAIFTDVIDAHRFYMPEKLPDAYFMKGTIKPYRYSIEGGYIFGTLSEFLNEKAKYSKGILIVEDWESILPEDIKQYAKKNMKRVIRVEGLKDAPNDPWPLEVYKWGN